MTRVQLIALNALISFDGWRPGCIWRLDSYTKTSRVLESLVQLGLATKTVTPVHEPLAILKHGESVSYVITDAGRKAVGVSG